VDRSLVAVAERAGGPRYRLLESVADYGLQRLREAGELDRVRLAHHEYYADLAERADAQLRGHDQRRWLELLDADAANLRTAVEGAAQRGASALALRLVNGLAWYWLLRGRLAEARRSLSLALAVEGDPLSAARARATAWHAGITLLSGYGDAPADAALRLFDEVDDPDGQAMARWFVGFAKFSLGDLSVSEDLVHRALDRFRATGDRWGVATALATQPPTASPGSAASPCSSATTSKPASCRNAPCSWPSSRATNPARSSPNSASASPPAAKANSTSPRPTCAPSCPAARSPASR
jgi:hypothetical protein